MEGITWIRLGVIAALFVGSLYVLAPTVLQGDIEAQREAAAAAIDTPSTKTTVDLDVAFETADAEGAVLVVRERLLAANVSVERVKVADGAVEVSMKPGASRDQVVSLATAPGAASLHGATAVSPVPATLPGVPEAAPVAEDLWAAIQGADAARSGWWGAEAAKWALKPVPASAPSLGTPGKLAGTGMAFEGGLPEGEPFAVVAVDGRMVGVAVPSQGALSFLPLSQKVQTSTGAEYLTDADALALLASGPLPGPVKELPELEEVAETKEDAELVESSVPPWVLSMLPNTVIALGLDLQGGLDLTLQVELDDAVLSQVARDATYVKEQAARENIELSSVRKEKATPTIWFETETELSVLSEFLRQRLSDYIYSASEGNRHAFTMTDKRVDEVQKQAVEQVLETLRKRVDATGVKEPSIVKKGGGRINVQLPGKVDLQAAVDAIGTTAVLEFRMVDPKFDQSVLERIIDAAEDALPPEQFADDMLLNEWLWDTKRLEEDRMVLWQYEETTDGDERLGPLVLINEIVLTGNDVNDASVGWDQNQQPYVGLNFKPRGSQIFCEVTTKHVRERFAIILDGMIRSAPSIRERICGGRASIEMGGEADGLESANTLALVLRTGSLDAPVSIGEVRQVGATLGRDSINAGSLASVMGGMVVLVFMGIRYRRSGLLADVALCLNVLMVIAALAVFGATLTLPGIAGIALTVGMAVDANIIIFERIREELALGVHPRKAVDTGFEKGLVAVLDANITTAIAGVVLFSYGTGPIKGFAVTLLIGIITTLITALFVTRTLMELVTRSSSARITI